MEIKEEKTMRTVKEIIERAHELGLNHFNDKMGARILAFDLYNEDYMGVISQEDFKEILNIIDDFQSDRITDFDVMSLFYEKSYKKET